MAKIKVYTRQGDDGHTSLVGGKRVPKTDMRLEAYGTVDELNSHIGLLLVRMKHVGADITFLQTVQHKLFKVGTRLATQAEVWGRIAARYAMTREEVTEVEQAIDRLTDHLPPLDGFVLPGGSLPAAEAHVCRTLCRRAERRIMTLDALETLEPELKAYVNRLSDYFFVLARFLNSLTETEEFVWLNT